LTSPRASAAAAAASAIAERILNVAEARVGAPDTDSPVLRPNLERLVAAILADSQMTTLARDATFEALSARTVHRLQGLAWLRDHPEIADEQIEAPVFLTGLPRSGTTAFHYLFDNDPRFRQIRTWEAEAPSPPPGFDPGSAARRKADEAAQRDAMVLPEGFDAMHLMDLDGPQECHMFLEQAYAAAGFHNTMDVPAYFDALVDEIDLAAAYRIHRRQLQLLQWRSPARRWSLKYPNHVLAMNEIVGVYPDARFVMTHRDPVQTLASIAKLSTTFRQLKAAAPVDPHRVGAQMLHFVRRHIDRIMEFVRGPEADRVVHVDYYRMLDAPAAVIADVHAGLGIDTPQEVRRAVADWHTRNPKGARGANPYALQQFGLDGDAVAERFADYMQHFDIPREQEGLGHVSA
jgi:hypothetical protein